jgi:hypothetical protein
LLLICKSQIVISLVFLIPILHNFKLVFYITTRRYFLYLLLYLFQPVRLKYCSKAKMKSVTQITGTTVNQSLKVNESLVSGTAHPFQRTPLASNKLGGTAQFSQLKCGKGAVSRGDGKVYRGDVGQCTEQGCGVQE